VRVINIVCRLCAGCREQVHEARFRAVAVVVEAIMLAQRVTLTAVGRTVRSAAMARHRIKMVDRLLGNARLQRERLAWFAAVAERLVRGQRRVVVLLDWTKIHGELWALVASVPYVGRSLPILAEARHESEVGSREVHIQFLRALRRVLPMGNRTVIVADGGFRSPFFRACAACGMDFVIRLRNDRAVVEYIPRGKRIKFSRLFGRALDVARCMGMAWPYASSSQVENCRLVLAPSPPKANRRRRYRDDYERKRAAEPWLLATSLENSHADTIVQIYRTRMQIEESFRDAKNPRFGWALGHTLTRSVERMNVLLLLAAIALVATMLVGGAADADGLERQFRASSRAARVLSLFALGSLILRHAVPIPLYKVWKQLKVIRRCTAGLFPRITPPRSENRNVSLPLPHDLFCADCGWNGAKYGWPA
jgi:Transposase DDE domain